MNSKQRREARYQRRKLRRKKKTNIKNFSDVFSYSLLCDSGYKSCNGVNFKSSTTYFRVDIPEVANEQYKRVKSNTYSTDGFEHFTKIERGHSRTIDAQKIKDRMVQKCFCDNYLSDEYFKHFIYDNYANQPSKGTHLAIKRLKKALIKHYRKYGLNGGILQLDFKSYFASLSHSFLKEKADEIIQDKQLRDFLYQRIDDFQLMIGVTKDSNEDYRGIGLGSQVSQVLALDYVNKLDHIISNMKNVEFYGRYMDDCFIICNNLKDLYKIQEYLFNIIPDFKIQFNAKKCKITPFKGENGFKFLKVRFKLTKTGKVIVRPNKNRVQAMRKKIKMFKDRFVYKDDMEFEDILSSYQSWRASIKDFNSFLTLLNMDEFFEQNFRIDLYLRDRLFVNLNMGIANGKQAIWVYYRKEINNNEKHNWVNNKYKEEKKKLKTHDDVMIRCKSYSKKEVFGDKGKKEKERLKKKRR